MTQSIVQIEGAGASAPARSNFSDKDRPDWSLYSTCIHCGLCLNHCPTHRVLGLEADSPRGRIYQVLQVDEGRLPISDPFVTHIDRCLGCLACETACPSGVQYGHIVERARAQIEQHFKRPAHVRFFRWLVLRKALQDFGLLSRLATFLRFYQRSGLQWIARQSGIVHLLRVTDVEKLAPVIDREFFFEEFGMVIPAEGEKRGRVAFHAGCIANVAFSSLNRATVQLLSKNGVEVLVLAEQRCCGALHAHNGMREDARVLAIRNIDALRKAAGEFDAIITNSAGCGSHMKDYADLLKDNVEYADSAQRFATLTKDVTEYLAYIGLRTPLARKKQTIAYQDPCHLAHAQKVRSAPRELLRSVGYKLVELPHPDQCCGSAGTYNIAQNELSMKILDAKMDDVATVLEGISELATANTGCMLQLQAGMRDRGWKLPVRHVVEILNECY
jgi:glycolate oxidase iron-sulfur subunit